MPWNSGRFERTNGNFRGVDVWQKDDAAGFGVQFTRQDTHDQDIAQGLSACLNRDGSTPMRANLAMGGNRVTGVGAPSAAGDLLRVGDKDYLSPISGGNAIADIPMNGFKFTNLSAPVFDTEMARIADIKQNVEWALIQASSTTTPIVISSSGGVTAVNISSQITNVIFPSNASSINSQVFFCTSCAQNDTLKFVMQDSTPNSGWKTVNSTYVTQSRINALGIQKDFYIMRFWL